jgi:Tol biopolymer transport system component
MNADGRASQPDAPSAHDNFAAWSPDSKCIAFFSTRDGGHDVYAQTVPADTDK